VGGELNDSEKKSLRLCLEKSKEKAWGLDDSAWITLKQAVLA
jgi:hypothetical protein